MNRLSLGWLTLPTAEPFELIPAAAAAGFQSVGLRVANRPGPPVAGMPAAGPGIIGNAPRIRAMKRALKDNGITALHLGAMVLAPDTPVRSYAPVLELGAEFETDMAVIVADPRLEGQQLMDNFCTVCELARGFDMRIGIEFVVYMGIKTIEQADRMITASGVDNAGIVLDSLHLYRSGGDAQSVRRIAPERIFFAQLSDGPLPPPQAVDLSHEARASRLDAGDGQLPLAELVKAMPPGLAMEVEAPCPAFAHLSTTERALRAADAVRRLLAQAAQVA